MAQAQGQGEVMADDGIGEIDGNRVFIGSAWIECKDAAECRKMSYVTKEAAAWGMRRHRFGATLGPASFTELKPGASAVVDGRHCMLTVGGTWVDMTDVVLDEKQVAGMFGGVSVMTLRRWRDKHGMPRPSFYVGNRGFTWKSELMEWIAQQPTDSPIEGREIPNNAGQRRANGSAGTARKDTSTR